MGLRVDCVGHDHHSFTSDRPAEYAQLQASVRGDKRINICINRLVMEEDAVSCSAFEGGA